MRWFLVSRMITADDGVRTSDESTDAVTEDGANEPSPSAELGTSRIEALCDGIFAVAMTLLVLGLAAPNAHTTPPRALPAAILHLGPELLTFVISFVNLGVLWVGQHNQYHFIRRSDRWFIWINVAFLMSISVIPFSTALLGQYPLDPFALSSYGATIVLATMLLDWHWWYASSNRRLVYETTPDAVIRLGHRRTLRSAMAYALDNAHAWVSPVLALALFLAVPLSNVVPFAVDRHLKRI